MKVIYNNGKQDLPTCSLVDEDGDVIRDCSKCNGFKDAYPEGCLHLTAFEEKLESKGLIEIYKADEYSRKQSILKPILFILLLGTIIFSLYHMNKIPNIEISIGRTQLETESMKNEMLNLQTEILSLRTEVKTLNDKLEKLLTEKNKVTEVTEPESIQYKHKIVIPYFKQYWDNLSNTSTVLFDTKSSIRVISSENIKNISVDFVHNGTLVKAKLMIDKAGCIYYDNCTQWEAEVIMQKLLNKVQNNSMRGDE